MTNLTLVPAQHLQLENVPNPKKETNPIPLNNGVAQNEEFDILPNINKTTENLKLQTSKNDNG